MDFFAAGLAAINTAFKANEQIMEALAAPDKNIDELLRRTREINGLLINAQSALHSAADENYRMKKNDSEETRLQQLRDDMEICQDGGFFIKKSEKAAGKFVPYCGTCWGEEIARPLVPGMTSGLFSCSKDHSVYRTREYHDREKKKLEEMARRNYPRTNGGPGSWMA